MKFSLCEHALIKILAVSVLWFLGQSVLYAQKEEAPKQASQKTEQSEIPDDLAAKLDEIDSHEAAIAAFEKMEALTEQLNKTLPKLESIVPEPEVAIPDDPPPYEGAWFNLPVKVNPPDLLLVEVREALPGRPMTGERLIRPDGTISLGFYGDVQVRGLTLPQVKLKVILQLRKLLTDEALGLIGGDRNGEGIVIEPLDSDTVLVDLAAYNSQFYYIQGDVHAPGRLPWTGNETVLDALVYAGHPSPLADLSDIMLYRPARGGKPAKTYKIDYEAIRHGDKRANLQLFPGDRIEVGRAAIVKSTINLDRVAAPVNTWAQTIRQIGLAVKDLDVVIDKAELSPEQRRQVYAALFGS